MVNTLALIGVVVSLISVILFIFNGVYFQQIYEASKPVAKTNTTLGALAANTNSRAYSFMIINYVFGGLMVLALIYFIFAAFRTPEVVEKVVPAPVPVPARLPQQQSFESQMYAGQALTGQFYNPAGCPQIYPPGCNQRIPVQPGCNQRMTVQPYMPTIREKVVDVYATN